MSERGARKTARTGGLAVVAAVWIVLGATAGLAAPGDVVFERKDGQQQGFAPAVFPHWVHRIRYRCAVCHPAIFEMKAGANEITMEAINAGAFCGRCHNGRAAFLVEFQTCALCHKAPED